MHKILGIETSCDDTCVAIVSNTKEILCNFIYNQHKEHSKYSGVVPEIAARIHNEKLYHLMNNASKICKLNNLSAVSVTAGPGLIGGLITGVVFAKTLASILNIPFIAINHLEAHALTILMNHNLEFPYLTLLISGGHCQFIAVMGLSDYIVIGSTLDDALGETFDKLAKMLKLGYPGGPIIEQKALKGDSNKYKFVLPMISTGCANMSFSGLKTQLKIFISKFTQLDEQTICDICASFQKTILEILINKTSNAIKSFYRILEARGIHLYKKNLILCGGVASNQYLRNHLSNQLEKKFQFQLLAPPINLCTDNAAMIAYTGLLYFNKKKFTNINFAPLAKWHLESLKISQ